MLRIDCDVLVIGGGGAGLMAAYAAARKQARVALVNKGKVQRTGATIMAPGAIAAVDERWKREGDSPERHLQDTILGGAFINDQEMVETVIRRAPDLILELERMGAIFQRDQGGRRFALRIDGGHSFPRCPFLEDRTGREMLKAMVGALRRLQAPFYEDIMITRLIRRDGWIRGAVGISLTSGDAVLFECGSVVLATGGAGTIYANTDNPEDLTGDGYALALRAGAVLRDMEFVQFYPLGFLSPPSLKGMLAGLLYFCRLLNAKNERFMTNYDRERLELSTRDRVARAIMREVKEGRGGPLGGVYMDLTHNDPGFIARMTPALNSTYAKIGIDPEKVPVEVAPTAHFFMGGMEVDGQWRSRVPGLFGAGEVCGGMHGGNRLSQNALSEVLVSGMLAGEGAAAVGKDRKRINPEEVLEEEERLERLLANNSGISPLAARNRLKKVMWEEVGVSRSELSLKRALAEIEELSAQPLRLSDKGRLLNRELRQALELANMLTTAKCVTLSARLRKESRGAHFREDYPGMDNGDWLVNSLISESSGGIVLESRRVETRRLSPEAT